jgi:hypothetical protein
VSKSRSFDNGEMPRQSPALGPSGSGESHFSDDGPDWNGYARRSQVINCLVEGNSIRSTERMTDTHRDTVMRLGVEVGTGCAKAHGRPHARASIDKHD